MANMDAYRNDDLVVGIRWLGVLDISSRPECRIRDGLTYSLDSPIPLPRGHSVPWLSGPGHIVPRCRCMFLPVLRSWRELGIPIDDGPVRTRASMSGQVSADWGFSEWIEHQAPALQVAALGTARGALMHTGGLTFRQLYSEIGHYYSIDELRALYPIAFAISGLR